MKKIINGRKYDTDTAKFLVSESNGLGYRDFGYCEETLYRKKNGEFFLYGEGGPMTKYAQRVDMNTWSGGCKITPLTEEEAKRWTEQRASVDAYEKIFGEVEE